VRRIVKKRYEVRMRIKHPVYMDEVFSSLKWTFSTKKEAVLFSFRLREMFFTGPFENIPKGMNIRVVAINEKYIGGE
jgi:hypothetical protein